MWRLNKTMWRLKQKIKAYTTNFPKKSNFKKAIKGTKKQ